MLTISKLFTTFCLLCLCGNREYPGNFQTKSIISSFKWVPKYIPGQTKGRWKAFLKWTNTDLSFELSFACEGNVSYYRCVYHPIPTLSVRTRNSLAISRTNPSALVLVEFPDMFSSWRNWRGEEGLFWRVQERGSHCEITPKSTWLS